MNNFITFLRKKKATNSLLELFLIISPLVDLITGLSVRLLEIEFTLGILLRSLLMLFLIYYVLFKSDSKYKKISVFLLGFIAIYSAFFLFNNIYLKGYSVFLEEFKTLFKGFYFPICLIAIVNYLDSKKRKFDDTIFIKVAFIYSFFILIPFVLNLDFSSYGNGKLGTIGWFYSANELGAILVLFTPFIMEKIINFKYKNKIYAYILFAIFSFLMLQIGTKVPLLGIAFTIFTILFIMIIDLTLWKRIDYLKKYLMPIILMFVITSFMFSISPLASNIGINTIWNSGSEKNNNIDPSKKPDLNKIIYSSRDIFKNQVHNQWISSKFIQQSFGLGYVNYNTKQNSREKLVEMDYYDIFYIFGVVGFIIYFAPLILVCYGITNYFIRNFKKNFMDNDITIYIMSILLGLGMAYFSGHILMAPAVSFYLTVILSSLLLKLKKQSELETIN
jgi:hypothetical protein